MDFDIEYRDWIGRIMTAMNTAKRKGLFACGSLIDTEGLRQRDVFDVGLSLVCMGCDREDIKTVLENIESHQRSPQWRLLDKVALHGILGIQRGESTGYMSLVLDSLIPHDERINDVVEEVTEYLLWEDDPEYWDTVLPAQLAIESMLAGETLRNEHGDRVKWDSECNGFVYEKAGHLNHFEGLRRISLKD
jgi:hypothetical protein